MSGKKEGRATIFQPKPYTPNLEYKPPPNSPQVLPSNESNDSLDEVSESKQSSSPSLDSDVASTSQPRAEPKFQKPKQIATSNNPKTSVTSSRADESGPVRDTNTGSRRWLVEFALVVMGAGGVDKSRFVLRCVIDEEAVILDILDTAGQEEYSSMREQYMKTGEGFMLMYSITSRTSFDELLVFQQQVLRVKDEDYFPMIVVGHHCDREKDRQISKEEGEALARSFGCPFLEASAERRINVEKAFYDLVREIRRHRAEAELQEVEEQELAPPRGGLKEFFLRRRRP
ncbi:uncharacterized protein PAC_00521 [Phialocephala subalpina]|uniref:Uncharacterized protein n=1 Tax=Phialocephala subalpina TaxID=576137 RepID=A0A1L7WD05_9HELO|nr:uncharacterized protein PAC_00521 [Phialocephala subalpina]